MHRTATFCFTFGVNEHFEGKRNAEISLLDGFFCFTSVRSAQTPESDSGRTEDALRDTGPKSPSVHRSA